VDTSQVSVQVRGKESQKRRFRAAAEKRRIVEETLEPGASVAKVAGAHGVNANQVFAWRREYRQGLLGTEQETANLLPVHVTGTGLSNRHGTGRRYAAQGTTEATGAIYVELPKGQLRITGCVDAEALRAVLEQLLG
jgi:transposase